MCRSYRLEAGKVTGQLTDFTGLVLGGRGQGHAECQMVLILHGRSETQGGPATNSAMLSYVT